MTLRMLFAPTAATVFVAAAFVATAAQAAEPAGLTDVPDALARYVARDDGVFDWRVVDESATELGRVYQLRLASQSWQGITWKHAVEVYAPKELPPVDHALLFVTGGSTVAPPSPDDTRRGLQLATLCGAPVVMLHQTPNQPLLGGRKEDDLISETWLRYLESGDDSWPLLLPMVKSAVRAMDAFEAFSESEFDNPISRFVITGASKRGWTSWLTPVVDERITATAPIVIDVLNFRAQMNHQLATWGSFSPQIRDYTRKGLVKRPGEAETVREVALRRMMDPYTYRRQLALPKLLIVGTNDPYWVVDAMNVYYDDLVGPCYIRQIPNAGHSLGGGRDAAMRTLAVFFRHAAAGKALPQVSWDADESDDALSLTLSSPVKPQAVKLWSARSDDLDFRDAHWNATLLSESDGNWTGSAARPADGHVAVFGEFEFESRGLPWSLTTLVFRR